MQDFGYVRIASPPIQVNGNEKTAWSSSEEGQMQARRQPTAGRISEVSQTNLKSTLHSPIDTSLKMLPISCSKKVLKLGFIADRVSTRVIQVETCFGNH